jgi:vacuolar-type H+-ATPase subunit I/STV1
VLDPAARLPPDGGILAALYAHVLLVRRSTVFWGVLFSSYFGDAVKVISRTFFGREVGIPPLWSCRWRKPMTLLMFCLAIGVVHLVTGYVMKARNLASGGKYLDISTTAAIRCFCSRAFWCRSWAAACSGRWRAFRLRRPAGSIRHAC